MSTPDNPFEQIIIPTIAPSAWPPAPIYWLLLMIIIISIALSAFFIKRHINKKKIPKQALSSLQALQVSSGNFAQLNRLLKGVSLQYYPRSQVASLTGGEWFQFIQQHNAQQNTPLFEDQSSFCERLYQAVSPCTEHDFKAAEKWILQFPTQVSVLQKSTSVDMKLTGKKHV